MIYLVIVLILAFVFWSMYSARNFGPKFRLIDNRVYESLNNSKFAISINYHVSALINRGLKKLIAINVTIVNKKDTRLNNLTIVAEPGRTLIPASDITLLDEKTKHNFPPSPLQDTQFDAGNISVEGMQMVSGYIFFETNSDYCDIDKLVVKGNDEVEELIIRKENIMSEKTVQFPLSN